jgi:hypothetical protein
MIRMRPGTDLLPLRSKTFVASAHLEEMHSTSYCLSQEPTVRPSSVGSPDRNPNIPKPQIPAAKTPATNSSRRFLAVFVGDKRPGCGVAGQAGPAVHTRAVPALLPLCSWRPIMSYPILSLPSGRTPYFLPLLVTRPSCKEHHRVRIGAPEPTLIDRRPPGADDNYEIPGTNRSLGQ